MFKNKTIALVGGTGTLGNALTEHFLKEGVKRIRIISRDEKKQWEMNQKFNDDRLRFLVGDVRDKDRMMTALQGVDYVIHAAALKQVPSCEYNPFEAVKTNILGTQNVIEACIANKVKTLVGVSTDKAVSPLNLYGATKMALERLMIAGNVYNKKLGDTKMVCVRYGNVIGSRGSVIELWEKQLKEGKPLTLTDERMTRFWMPIETAVKLIMTAIKEGKGGEIFIPKAPKRKMKELAIETMIAPQADYISENKPDKIKLNGLNIIGLRPSEKLHECLINEHEANRTYEYSDHYVIAPEFLPHKLKGKKYKGGAYTSEIQWEKN